MFRAISNGAVSGSDFIKLNVPAVFGGVVVTLDGTNAGTVKIYRSDGTTKDTGKCLLSFSGKSAVPLLMEGEQADFIWYTISGTGASAQIFEFVK
jgi:hypothetical protein